MRAISSVGRAPPLQGGGHWFETSIAHHYFLIFIIHHQIVFKIGCFAFYSYILSLFCDLDRKHQIKNFLFRLKITSLNTD